MAVANFHNQKSDRSLFACTVHVYTSKKWFGEVLSTEEMRNPNWYSIKTLDKENLMLADQHWLPAALSGKKIIVNAWYGPYQKTLLRKVEFVEVSTFENE